MSRPGRPAATAVHVLLAYGSTQDDVVRLAAALPDLEHVVCSLDRHRDTLCGGADSCPWHQPGPLAGALDRTMAAVDAWCSVGWLERDLLGPGTGVAQDRRIAHDGPR